VDILQGLWKKPPLILGAKVQLGYSWISFFTILGIPEASSAPNSGLQSNPETGRRLQGKKLAENDHSPERSLPASSAVGNLGGQPPQFMVSARDYIGLPIC
jgi:hypothetical protein